MNSRLLLVAAALISLASACTPKGAPEQLPPSGLAGAPQSAPLKLPGAGVAVADPSGNTTGATALPPGHPKIPDDNESGAVDASDHPGLPPNHPGMPGSADPAGAPAMGAMGAQGDPVLLTGPVLETMDVPEYTYMRVKTSGGDTWCAVNKTPVAVGDVVTVNQSLVMSDFFSKGLNRKFDKLVMGMLVGAPKKPG